MSDAPSRRGFLRGLVTLPLIGGGVTLIGRPTGVAEPVSLHLLSQYASWIEGERQRVAHAIGIDSAAFHLDGPTADWHRLECQGTAEERRQRAATRAAVVLSAVGCDWRSPGERPWMRT